MTRILLRLVAAVELVAAFSLLSFGQISSTSSLSGAVVDSAGARVAGATVLIKHIGAGTEFQTTTNNQGLFTAPALNAGVYTVTVTAPGFKQAVVREVKLDAAVPANINITLEVGEPTESVVVEGAGELLQTQSANIATTITGRQITELPFASRDALDLVTFMPGVNTPRNPRSSNINGLPESTINITIDGINVQNNDSKSSDGYFTYVRPRIDAIEEVTVSTATPGAESSGEGAVQIKFVTRSGGNEFHGSLYEYHRDWGLNANYWFNNRDSRPRTDPFDPTKFLDDPKTFKAPRDRLILNQYGFRVSGPFRFPKKLFGPFAFDGRDKAFFFLNYEEYYLPNSINRTRTILHPQAQQGFIRYIYTDPQTRAKSFREVDLLRLAANSNCAPTGQPAIPCLSTVDPTIAKLLTDIRAATGVRGSVEILEDPDRVTNPIQQRYVFPNFSTDRRYFPTLRLDFNLTSKHHLETTYNYQRFTGDADLLNSADPAFPGFPNFGNQHSHRYSNATALRSTLTPTLVNEARFGFSGGPSYFNANVSRDDFTGSLANQAGFNLGSGTPGANDARGVVAALGIHGPTRRTGGTHDNTMAYQFNDTLSWTRGAHNLNFGVSFTQISDYGDSTTTVPTITFGVDANDPAAAMFSAQNQPTNFPGAASADLTRARNLYAVLTGRVTSIAANANLNEETGQYEYLGKYTARSRQRELGFFAQDSWRLRPNLTLSLGLRYELEFPFLALNNAYSFTSVDDLFGVSGPGNLFKPGVLTGKPTSYTSFKEGSHAYNVDKNNLAPSVGFAYSASFKHGYLRRFFGDGGQTVLRGGFSLAYNRDSIGALTNPYASNPGGFITATRSITLGNLVGGDRGPLPLLLRESQRLGAPAFDPTPKYPLFGEVTNRASAIDPNLKVPYSMSWSFGLQREITKNMVIEARYVATRGLQFLDTFEFNGINIVENGLLAEFKLAQANLLANNAAGGARAGSFAYFGPGTGTQPLPIALAYFSGLSGAAVNLPASYNSPLFTSLDYVNELVSVWPNPNDYATNMENNAARRANALRAGLPANFFRVNPDKLDGARLLGNSGHTIYDSGVLEFRRRMSKGLMVQANYVFSRGFSLIRPSLRAPRYKTVNELTTTHAFKVNWIYELPIGKGKLLAGGAGALLDKVIGGWEWHGTTRIQSGIPLTVSNTRLIGMTRNDFQKSIKIRFDDAGGIVYYLPQDIIDNTIRAHDVNGTTANGYGSRGAPEGRYLAPSNSADCIEIYSGQCGIPRFVFYGPPFARFDMSAIKRIRFTERANFEFRAEFMNAFNRPNFSLPDTFSATSLNVGRITAAYRDTSTTNDPGGRLIQLVGRFNF